MGGLKVQRRVAAKILKCGVNRVWIDPEKIGLVESAVTADSIKKLIHDGVIAKKKVRGTSRVRARERGAVRKKRGRTPGRRKGAKGSILSSKRKWIMRIRPMRKFLRNLKNRGRISVRVYRKLYLMAKGGFFSSKTHLKSYIVKHKLWRK